ncbi:hypothetical protein TPSea814_000832a [Treponema pallidum subsp. pallidum str. Sea 81-4]|nr:hypothetical protein TPSea814_000832a [Treponema pallidum subsp. pallidum str. Sea 81-4]
MRTTQYRLLYFLFAYIFCKAGIRDVCAACLGKAL